MRRVICKQASRRPVAMRFMACAAALLSLATASANALSITQWDLGVMVDGDGLQQDFSVVVQNPYTGSLLAAPTGHLSRAASQHQFVWAEHVGTFLTQSQQTAAGAASAPGTVTSASGFIRLTSAEPLPMHIDASWTFGLPADYMTAYLLVSVFDAQNHVTIFGQNREASTLPGEPASGTLTINGDVLLPPGPTWTLRYSMELDTYPGTAPYTAHGTGSVLFSITPEPASLVLLAPLVLMLPRCQGHRKRAASP